ncbi:hypothetical protein IZ6_25470 [Terrihabitans soli]|uniref:Uncharacterized protein n=1 Tax=Terrihabitans soli TaxID=708113 RepID=A0A6S6QX30_9HYPH|nr:hypothetical protein [Terrihabitans soli]BCJ91812.1 hypothetical protein IZ6_25470 [Terrihabitans soli]
MKLPASIKIGPYVWKIQLRSKTWQKREGKFGFCRFDDFAMDIVDDLPPLFKAEIVHHEIGHAIWWTYNLDSREREERAIMSLSRGYIDLWADNPELLRWFAAQLPSS